MHTRSTLALLILSAALGVRASPILPVPETTPAPSPRIGIPIISTSASPSKSGRPKVSASGSGSSAKTRPTNDVSGYESPPLVPEDKVRDRKSKGGAKSQTSSASASATASAEDGTMSILPYLPDGGEEPEGGSSKVNGTKSEIVPVKRGASGKGPFTGGDFTWYEPTKMGGMGACGFKISDEEPIVALAHGFFDTYPGQTGNPNTNPLCGKMITATLNGKSIKVKIADRCHDCNNPNSIDVPKPAFEKLADPGLGRVKGVSWTID